MMEIKCHIQLLFRIFGLAACLYFLPIHISHAQFLDLQLEIEPKVSAETLQQLNFGTLAANTGRQSIVLGDANMGVFSITALEDQVLLFSLQTPQHLIHDNPGIDDTIPLNLSMHYGYTLNNPQNSQILPHTLTAVEVENSDSGGPWSSIYLFIFGSVDIGDVADGFYRSQIVLNVEYL